MDKKLEHHLVSLYPSLYRDYEKTIYESPMAWGFSCGDGWYSIIANLSYKITKIDVHRRVVVDQVKEKFGGLRYYFHIEDYQFKHIIPWSLWIKIPYKIRNKLTKIRQFFYKTFYEKICDLVYEAEEMSFITCEICGKVGKIRGNGWLAVRCDSCEEEEMKNK